MRPILFDVFGVPVYSYGFLLAVAFAVATLMVSRGAARRGIDPDRVLDLALIICIAAVVGSRALFVGLNISYYYRHPAEIFDFRSGGLSFFGGLGLGLLSGLAYCRVKRIRPWVLADLSAPFIALGYSIVRIGCLMEGCCYGVPTSVPWALQASGSDDLLRHPTQLYSSAGSFLIFLYLYKNRDKRSFDGSLFATYIGLYSILRFVVEVFRDSDRVIAGLSAAQLLCIVTGVGAFVLLRVLTVREQAGGRGVSTGA